MGRLIDWFTSPSSALGWVARGLIVLLVIGVVAAPFTGPEPASEEDGADDSVPSSDGTWETRRYWSLFVMNHANQDVEVVVRNGTGGEVLNTSLDHQERTPDRLRDHVCTEDPGHLNVTVRYFVDNSTSRTFTNHTVTCSGSVEVNADGTHRNRQDPDRTWYLYIEPGPNLSLVPETTPLDWVDVQILNQCSETMNIAVFFSGTEGAAVLSGDVPPDDQIPPVSPRTTNWTVGHEMTLAASAYGDLSCGDSFEFPFTPEEKSLIIVLNENGELKWMYA